VEILYNEYQFTAAFAVASLLCLLALVTLIAKHGVERKIGQHALSATVDLTRRQVP
jgi:sulfate transport system permease protein